MKLNSKGMTLLELLISIVFVGVVLVFLFQLLTDLRNENENNNFAYNNQVNRIEAIYTVGKDLDKYTLTGIENVSANGNLIINFYLKKGLDTKTAVLSTSSKTTEILGVEIVKNYLHYTDYEGNSHTWEMKGATIDPCGYFVYYIDNLSNNYYFKLNIYIYNSTENENNNAQNNNAVDDIEITYLNDKSQLILTDDTYLTWQNKVEKNIGICANK